jgi:hypothetical protein
MVTRVQIEPFMITIGDGWVAESIRSIARQFFKYLLLNVNKASKHF